jgi:hypothetical protein
VVKAGAEATVNVIMVYLKVVGNMTDLNMSVDMVLGVNKHGAGVVGTDNDCSSRDYSMDSLYPIKAQKSLVDCAQSV